MARDISPETRFIESHAGDVAIADVVAAASAVGLELTPKQVSQVRLRAAARGRPLGRRATSTTTTSASSSTSAEVELRAAALRVGLERAARLLDEIRNEYAVH